jgi:PST family polysaccharide transporter
VNNSVLNKLISQLLNKKENYLFYGSNLIRSIIPILIFPYCLKLIGSNDFGVLSGEYATALLAAFIIDYSVIIYGTAEIAKCENEKRNEKIIQLFALRCTIFFLVMILTLLTSSLLNFSSNLIILVIAAGLNAVFDISWIYLWNKKFYTFFVSHIIGFGCGIGIFLYLHNLGLIEANNTVLGLIVMPTLLANFLSVVFLICKKENLEIKFINVLSVQNFYDELKSKAPIFSSQIISALYTSTGPIILNIYDKPDYAALWMIVNRLAIGVGSFATLSIKGSIKEMMLEWSNTDKPITGKSKNYFLTYLLLVSPLILPLIFTPQLIDIYLFGSENKLSIYSRALMAVWVMMPFFAYIVTTFLIYKNKHRKLLYLTGSNLLIYLILSYPLTSIFGFEGFIFTMVFSQIYIFLIFFNIKFKTTNFN